MTDSKIDAKALKALIAAGPKASPKTGTFEYALEAMPDRESAALIEELMRDPDWPSSAVAAIASDVGLAMTPEGLGKWRKRRGIKATPASAATSA